ncbi:hypothetical protein L9F63_008219, partial [Diploptera punctata]
EHFRNIKNGEIEKSAIAAHSLLEGHRIEKEAKLLKHLEKPLDLTVWEKIFIQKNKFKSMNFDIPDERDLISKFIESTPDGNDISKFIKSTPDGNVIEGDSNEYPLPYLLSCEYQGFNQKLQFPSYISIISSLSSTIYIFLHYLIKLLYTNLFIFNAIIRVSKQIFMKFLKYEFKFKDEMNVYNTLVDYLNVRNNNFNENTITNFEIPSYKERGLIWKFVGQPSDGAEISLQDRRPLDISCELMKYEEIESRLQEWKVETQVTYTMANKNTLMTDNTIIMMH